MNIKNIKSTSLHLILKFIAFISIMYFIIIISFLLIQYLLKKNVFILFFMAIIIIFLLTIKHFDVITHLILFIRLTIYHLFLN